MKKPAYTDFLASERQTNNIAAEIERIVGQNVPLPDEYRNAPGYIYRIGEMFGVVEGEDHFRCMVDLGGYVLRGNLYRCRMALFEFMAQHIPPHQSKAIH